MKITFLSIIFIIISTHFIYSQNNSNNILYCKDFDSQLILKRQTPYQNCAAKSTFEDFSYYEITIKKGNVIKVIQFDQNKNTIRIENYSYPNNITVKRSVKTIDQTGETKYITSQYYTGWTSMAYYKNRFETFQYIPNFITSRIHMHDKKIFQIRYQKKIEKYQNDILNMVSYFNIIKIPNQKAKQKLIIRLFYNQQRIFGYTVWSYYPNESIEVSVINNQQWINYYNTNMLPEMVFYYDLNKTGMKFSLYYYNNDLKNQLLLREDYYTTLPYLKSFIVKHKKIDQIWYKLGKTILQRRNRWMNLFKPYGAFNPGMRNKKIWRNTFWHYKKLKSWDNRDFYASQPIDKIEYYVGDSIRKVVYYKNNGEIKQVERYNYRGEKIFDQE